MLANALHSHFGLNWLATKVAIDGVAEWGRTLGTVTVGASMAPVGIGDPSVFMAAIRSNADDDLWWSAQVASSKQELEAAAIALALLTCAKPSVLASHLLEIQQLVESLPVRRLRRLTLDSTSDRRCDSKRLDPGWRT